MTSQTIAAKAAFFTPSLKWPPLLSLLQDATDVCVVWRCIRRKNVGSRQVISRRTLTRTTRESHKEPDPPCVPQVVPWPSKAISVNIQETIKKAGQSPRWCCCKNTFQGLASGCCSCHAWPICGNKYWFWGWNNWRLGSNGTIWNITMEQTDKAWKWLWNGM